MKLTNRYDHIPVQCTKADLRFEATCPVCKRGEVKETKIKGMLACSFCGQRYQLKDKDDAKT